LEFDGFGFAGKACPGHAIQEKDNLGY